MPKRRRPRTPSPPLPGRRQAGETGLPSLVELDRFDAASMRQWQAASGNLFALHRHLHFGLEAQRLREERALIEAVRSAATRRFSATNWCRIVDYRHSLSPLSVAGSLSSIGGRFNVGTRLSPGLFTPFGALYCAEDYKTAFVEKFGSDSKGRGALAGHELALRKPGSFSSVRLNFEIEDVLDIRNPATLKPIVAILRTFEVPKMVTQMARKLCLRHAPWLIRSPEMLCRSLLHPDWRSRPMQFDFPANPQIFGRLVLAAGLHAIIYPSTKTAKPCVALFFQNWAGGSSWIELADPTPAGVAVARVDGHSPSS
jgi:hypothetical protein